MEGGYQNSPSIYKISLDSFTANPNPLLADFISPLSTKKAFTDTSDTSFSIKNAHFLFISKPKQKVT